METEQKTGRPCWPLVLIAICVGLGIANALGRLLPQVADVWRQLAWTALLTASLLTLAYRILNALGWALVMRSLGVRTSSLAILKIWLRSEACRWLPGSVWCLGSRAFLITQTGVHHSIAASSVALELLLTILAWMAACLSSLAGNGVSLADIMSRSHGGLWTPTVTIVVFGGLAVVALIAWTTGARRIDKLKQRLVAIRAVRPNVGWCAASLIYYLGLCWLNGLALRQILLALAPDVSIPLVTVVGINALAWLVGFSAVVAPSGVVVREACLAGLLLAWVPEPTAVAAAVLWRLVQIGVEVACLFATYVPTICTAPLRDRLLPPVRH